VLRYNRDAYAARVEAGEDLGDEGVEEAFDVVAEITDSVRTAKWIGDCFIYTTAANRLNYLVGSETDTVASFDQYVLPPSSPQTR
jgi:coatomer subunit beta'